MNLKKVTKIAQIAQNPRVLTIELIKENDFLVKNFVSPRFCQWVVKFGHFENFHENGRKTTLIHMTWNILKRPKIMFSENDFFNKNSQISPTGRQNL